MSIPELAKLYDPHELERRNYQRWLDAGIFHAHPESERPAYSIVIPPPNVTGELHVGHALNNTIQDVLIRHARMTGHETLWLPGTDHASIAVETKLVRALAAEGKSKQEIGREEFLKRAWEWREKYGGKIIDQLKRLGCSCDWERLRFTMDESLSKAVREAFVRYYELGLIYRDTGIVNWCPGCRTAISDAEVKHEDAEGKLWYIRYPAVDGNGFITIATTRPETMLGDTAVAVSLRDERYKHWIGREVMVPLINRAIPIVADEHVDMSFGTGAVKITPAHDPDDFWVAKRHNLPHIVIIDDRGYMTDEAGSYSGLSREECRKKVVEDLKELELLEKIEPHKLSIGHCERCHSIIEPLASQQWWLSMKPLAGPAMEAVRDGRIKFVPERWTKVYLDWMENIRDWVLSRQLWWGHRIPVWYCPEGHITVSRTTPDACMECGSKDITQDNDVLDTWFSSALWPFSTMGWPEQTEELKKFFPTDVLCTAPDIIFLWVARMIFSSLTFEGKIPFHTVILHPMVQNMEGQRMSKSLGTGFDPVEIIDHMGADAVRFTLMILTSTGQSFRLWEERFELGRNLTNKLWNAARLLLSNLSQAPVENMPMAPESSEDVWIKSRFGRAIQLADEAIAAYRFNDYASIVYEFFWHEYCDWYLEMIKPRLMSGNEIPERNRALTEALSIYDGILRLLHPIMPFISEELWQHLKERKTNELLATAEWHKADDVPRNLDMEYRFEQMMDIIKNLRNLRANMNVTPGAEPDLIISCADETALELLKQDEFYIARLGRCKPQFKVDAEKPQHSATGVSGLFTLYLPLEGLIDFDKERTRLAKEIESTTVIITKLSSQLDNTGFVQKAPPEVIEEVRQNLALAQSKREILNLNLQALN